MFNTVADVEVTFNREEAVALGYAVARALSEFEEGEEVELQRQLERLSVKLHDAW